MDKLADTIGYCGMIAFVLAIFVGMLYASEDVEYHYECVTASGRVTEYIGINDRMFTGRDLQAPIYVLHEGELDWVPIDVDYVKLSDACHKIDAVEK